MSLIGEFASPTPTLDSKTTIFDAIEYMILNDCDHAFVQHEDKMAGIVATSQLLENYKSEDMLGSTIREYMEPLLMIKSNEPEARAAEIMAEHDVNFIAVTNQNGVLLGVVSLNNLNSQPSSL